MHLETFFNTEDDSFDDGVLLEIYNLTNGEIRLQKKLHLNQ